jgi:hypothetical protein
MKTIQKRKGDTKYKTRTDFIKQSLKTYKERYIEKKKTYFETKKNNPKKR